jgi:hypothetical protein
VLCVAGALIGACAGSGSATRASTSMQATANAPLPRRDIRDLAIIPAVKTVCPGQSIAARYEAVLGDGSRVRIAGADLSRLALRGIAAVATPDGSWKASDNPLESIASGFRLSVSLATDPGVHADTVIVPSYSCERLSVGLPVSDRYNQRKARVRLGLLPSPFYDSVVVAVVEPEGGYPTIFVLDPPRMRARTLQVSAVGKPGTAGRPGNPGTDGSQCSNGGDGSDGDAGENGESGGQVDVIIAAEAPWLESLVGVSNSGGRGGAGGQGGRGGRPGARTSEPGCNPTYGRPGRAGRQGADGSPGPYPTTTTEEGSLLWRGSPIWFDSTARANLERLMERNSRRR